MMTKLATLGCLRAQVPAQRRKLHSHIQSGNRLGFVHSHVHKDTASREEGGGGTLGWMVKMTAKGLGI